MKLWLDDIRPAPEGWTWVKRVEDAIYYADREPVEEMSLDHDLGLAPVCVDCKGEDVEDDLLRQRFWEDVLLAPRPWYRHAPQPPDDTFTGPVFCLCSCHRALEVDGYQFVKWMAETGRWPTVKPAVHSRNVVGKKNMEALIGDMWFNPRLN
jgi:hypothetical protein